MIGKEEGGMKESPSERKNEGERGDGEKGDKARQDKKSERRKEEMREGERGGKGQRTNVMSGKLRQVSRARGRRTSTWHPGPQGPFLPLCPPHPSHDGFHHYPTHASCYTGFGSSCVPAGWKLWGLPTRHPEFYYTDPTLMDPVILQVHHFLPFSPLVSVC